MKNDLKKGIRENIKIKKKEIRALLGKMNKKASFERLHIYTKQLDTLLTDLDYLKSQIALY